MHTGKDGSGAALPDSGALPQDCGIGLYQGTFSGFFVTGLPGGFTDITGTITFQIVATDAGAYVIANGEFMGTVAYPLPGVSISAPLHGTVNCAKGTLVGSIDRSSWKLAPLTRDFEGTFAAQYSPRAASFSPGDWHIYPPTSPMQEIGTGPWSASRSGP